MSSDPNAATRTRFALRLSYVGTDFCGWQTQKGSGATDRPSIQTTINAALERITSFSGARVIGSGRTDAGVHALAQVAHTDLPDPGQVRGRDYTEVLVNGLNATLPPSVRVLAAARVPPTFHAQRSALRKQYSYYFQQGPAAPGHLSPYSYWVRRNLDIQRMSAAVEALIGEHDFKPFQASGAKPGPTVRRIFEAEVTRVLPAFPGGHDARGLSLIRFRVLGSGFLKQMVRGLAGTLLQIGEGYRPPTAFVEIIASQNRREVGPTAPARALWLENVWYDEPDTRLDTAIPGR